MAQIYRLVLEYLMALGEQRRRERQCFDRISTTPNVEGPMSDVELKSGLEGVQLSNQLAIGVICRGQEVDAELHQLAERVGAEIARAGCLLICGGLGGLMTSAAKGAKAAGGTTVGVIMGYDKESANEHIDITIATGMGHGRNVIVVASSDALIAIDGGPGTLAEMAYAATLGKPLVGLRTWQCVSPEYGELVIHGAADAREAVEMAVALAQGT